MKTMARMTVYLTATVMGGFFTLAHSAPVASEEVTYAVTTSNISTGHAAQSSIPLAMGYWEDEGLEVEVIGVSGATAGIQQVASGNVDFTSVGVEPLLNAIESGIDVKAFYAFTRRPYYQIVTLAENDIESMDDLRGKTIGVPEMAAGSVEFTRGMLRAGGIDPETDVNWLAVGLGAPAAHALNRGDIDVWAAWDTAVAALENAGFELRLIDDERFYSIPGSVIIARGETLSEHPELAVKIARGIAKATIFGLTNPAAAVRNHWKIYPETKPQSDNEEGALRDAMHIFNSRFNNMKVEDGVQWGENIDAHWDGIALMAKEEGNISPDFDIRSAYTNDLIDQINQFESAEVEAAAGSSDW